MSRPTEADFLSWGTQRVSFLAPRGFCEAGVYCPADEVDGSGFLVGQPLDYAGQRGPVFDLDAGLESWLGEPLVGRFPQALVVRAGSLSPRTRDLLGQWLGHEAPLLGFRIRSETRMVKLRTDELRWFAGATGALATFGFLGCQFPSDGRITYLIDPEALLCRALHRLQEAPDAHSPR